ncbi:hypothetical protein A2U01_0099734, partial [Trifolium medium]|nr:hypothetical protein [Trifolium medium]
ASEWYNPPSGGVIVAQRRFAGHSSLLINRLDQWRRLWGSEFSPSFFHQET